ncbi:MAG: ABC transporter permease [Oscillospiraceae bacterium]|nr:ABC transporter permease [Oscillospiraceae bacterium]
MVMRMLLIYIILQSKRLLSLLPRLLIGTVAVVIAGALAAGLVSGVRAGDESRVKTRIGVVYDEGDSYARAGVGALRHFDSSRNEAEFIAMDEAQAKAGLIDGSLTAYLYIPGDFFTTMYSDDINPMRFVTLSGSAGLDTRLLTEMAESIVRLMAETQAAEYGAVEYARENFPDSNPYEGYDDLIDRYFAAVLDRDKLYSVEIIGYNGNLSFAGHFFAGITFMLSAFWGIGLSPFFSRRSRELGNMLSVRALPAPLQVAGEATVIFAAHFINAVLVLALGKALLDLAGVTIPDKLNNFAAVAALTALCLSSTEMLIFELVPLPPASLMAHFINTAAQCFTAGCVYPRSFFPEPLRTIGALMPFGAAIDCYGGGSALAVTIWAILLLCLTGGIRLARQRGGVS